MKIVMAAHGFPPENEGGAELITYFQARELIKHHQVTVIHRINHPDRPEYQVNETTIDNIKRITINNTFKERPNFRWFYRNPNIDNILQSLLDKEKPDIVHIHHLTGLSTGFVQIAKDAGAKTVFTLHDFWMLCPRGQRLKPDLTWCNNIIESDCADCVAGWMIPPLPGKQQLPDKLKRLTSTTRTLAAKLLGKRRINAAVDAMWARNMEMMTVLESVDILTVPSNYLRSEFIAAGIAENHILRIPYGMDSERFLNLPERTSDPTGKLRIGYIGSLIPSKGVHLLIDTVIRLPENTARLDIYGEAIPYDGFPNYQNDLRRQAADRTNIRFHGGYSNREIGEILSQIDVVVVPSLWPENSPLTIQEAFLAGVPVIAANLGGMKEWLEKGGGLLFNSGEVDSLADALLSIIENPQQLESLRHSIPQVPKASEMYPVWDQLYQELLNQ